MKVKPGTFTIARECVRQRRRRVERDQPNGGRSVSFEPDGCERVWYTVLVDREGLDALAVRAAGSKGKRAKDGPVTVLVTKVAPESGR